MIFIRSSSRFRGNGASSQVNNATLPLQSLGYMIYMIYVSFQWILIASSYDQGTLSHLKHQRRWRMRLKTSLLKEPKHILYCIHSHILCMYSYTCLHWTCVSCLSRVYTDYSSYFAVMMMFGAHTLGHKNIFGSFTNLLRVSWKCDQKYTYNNLNFSAVKVTFDR